MSTTEPPEASTTPSPPWAPFAAVCAAYLAVTIGEAILAPVFPIAAAELNLSLSSAGLAFGVLAAAIAAGNIAGGHLLSRMGAKRAILMALVGSGMGAVAATTAQGPTSFFAAQGLLGLGAGLFFAPGIYAVGTIGGARRGLIMALFGVAFSAALTLAALLASIGVKIGWRLPFAVGALLCAVAALAVTFGALPQPPPGSPDGDRRPWRDAIGVPAVVGSAGAWVQYGTVSFLPAFAVATWDLSAGAAALALAAARLLSVPGKVITGQWADRFGPLVAAKRMGLLLTVTGAWWTLVPHPVLSLPGAVIFAAGASSVFPIANLLAYEGFGDRGTLLGTFRSIQMGIGAVGGLAIGAGERAVGLRPTLAISASVIPLALVAVAFRPGPAPVPLDAAP